MDNLNTVPVYQQSCVYAEKHNELDDYMKSQRENIACAKAIENAIGAHYDGYRLETEDAVNEVMQQFGQERTFRVLANTVQHKDWDGRFSRQSIEWAHSQPSMEDIDNYNKDRSFEYCVNRSSPGLVDLFLRFAVRYAEREKKPSIRAQLAVGKAEQTEKPAAKARSREEAR